MVLFQGALLFVMGCIRNQPGKGLPDARGLFAVRAGQPAGEERKSCHCQGPGGGEDKAVPAGGEQGDPTGWTENLWLLLTYRAYPPVFLLSESSPNGLLSFFGKIFSKQGTNPLCFSDRR